MRLLSIIGVGRTVYNGKQEGQKEEKDGKTIEHKRKQGEKS